MAWFLIWLLADYLGQIIPYRVLPEEEPISLYGEHCSSTLVCLCRDWAHPEKASGSWLTILPALCSYFKPTLILCPPAEKWLLEEAASPWEELAKVSVKELVPSCLFSCLSQASVETGKPFPWPCTCSSFLFPQPWQRSWREGKWNSLCLETFSELLHLLSSAGSLFVCVLKPPQMLSQPFILLRFPCWPPEQLSPWPLQPLMPTSWSASAQWQNPTLQTQAVLTENLMGPKVFRVGKPGEENAEFASPSPTVPGLGAPLLWLYWEVTPRRNILQFLMGMKANCNLQLNSSFCF